LTFSFRKITKPKRKALWLCALASAFLLLSCTSETKPKPTLDNSLSVSGEVKNPLELSLEDLKAMPSLFIKDVLFIQEKERCGDSEKFIHGAHFRGVLLKDVLLKAGMKYVRKWEPGVYITVYDTQGKEEVFSFGEIFYSSIGRSVLLAFEENDKPMVFPQGVCDLLVSTDLRAGRRLQGVSRIEVSRVDVEMLAYDDKKEKVVRPPTLAFMLMDHKTGATRNISLETLKALPPVRLPFAVMAGDCEGFRGIYSFEGILLKDLLVQSGVDPCRPEYNRYVLVASEDGFCATFSFGELFNSRLNNNLVIAYKLDDALLNESQGFAMSVAGEDNLGGRSVKRIQRIELF